jgi:hypothetical protein
MATDHDSCYNFDDETATDYRMTAVFLTPADSVPVAVRAQTQSGPQYLDMPVPAK